MDPNFGYQIKKFAVTVDIVTEETLFGALESIRRYLSSLLQVKAFGMLVEKPYDNGLSLDAVWRPGGGSWGHPIKKKDGTYYGQAAFAYDKSKFMWIVSADADKKLDETDKYEDLWSGYFFDEPKFIHNHSFDVHCSIILPLFGRSMNRKKTFGVLNLESNQRLTPSDDLKHELEDISKAVATLYELRTINAVQDQGTRSAVDELKEIAVSLAANTAPRTLAAMERRIFFAYPEKCDYEVKEIIKNAVNNRYKKEVILIDWEKDAKLGPIEIWSYLQRCQGGICYLSEKVNKDENTENFQFQDNPNVIFEAGMMEALSNAQEHIFQNWIPIREKNSLDAPVNFRNQNGVIVEREHDGSIKDGDEVTRRIVSMLTKIFDFSDNK